MSKNDWIAILAECRRIWDERERRFPAHVRMTWEQGTLPAREATMLEAMRNLGIEA